MPQIRELGPNVIEHFDKTIGVQGNQQVWSFKEKGFWIVKYDDVPCIGTDTYITAGLGRHLLVQESGSEIRQELLVSINREFSLVEPQVMLSGMCFDFLDRHIPIPDHQVIPFIDAPVFPEFEFSALYCTAARHMPEEFEIINDKPPLVFVWLIPVFGNEVAFIKDQGWSNFEKLIEKQNPDFCNLLREAIV